MQKITHAKAVAITLLDVTKLTYTFTGARCFSKTFCQPVKNSNKNHSICLMRKLFFYFILYIISVMTLQCTVNMPKVFYVLCNQIHIETKLNFYKSDDDICL